MKPHVRIGHRGAMHLERGLQSSRKPEKIGRLPFPRGIPVRVDSNGMKRDDQHPANKRGAIIHVPVRVCLREGYGMLLKMDFHDSTCDSNFRTNEQIDCPIRCNRYLDRTLQV
nr:MAG TPA: hypothetical protein [Caudoviricetes sp.]